MADRGSVHGELVGARAEDRAALIDGGDAAAGRQRNGQLGRDAANRFEECGPVVARCAMSRTTSSSAPSMLYRAASAPDLRHRAN